MEDQTAFTKGKGTKQHSLKARVRKHRASFLWRRYF